MRAWLKYENSRIVTIEGMCSIDEMKIIKVTYVYFGINSSSAIFRIQSIFY